jgi:hypothetical protein
MFPLALAVLFFIYSDAEVMVLLRSFFEIFSGKGKISSNSGRVALNIRYSKKIRLTFS